MSRASLPVSAQFMLYPIRDFIYMVVGDDHFTVYDHLISFDGDHLTGVCIHNNLYPGFQHTGSKFSTNHLFKAALEILISSAGSKISRISLSLS